MDDNAKIVNQNSNSVFQDQPQVPQAPVPVQPPQPVQPAQPVGSANKEMAPVKSPVSEFVKPTDTEPQISQELKDIGIEAKKDAPDITHEHQGIVEHAKQFSPVSASPAGKVTMPLSEEEVADKLKSGQDEDSGKGLAKLIDKVIKAMGFNLN
ncbi:MAG: hypothetical protein Q7R51_02765 [bacterium]|nr:hypothetical protein [bacterium]